MEPSTLAVFWAAVVAGAVVLYVMLDGFDLGVGILFGLNRDERLRGQMMTAIAPYWDGNETWLVVIGASLYAAFPAVYAVLLGAFYVPVILLLFGLVFRGIAFEFRYRSGPMRPLWDAGFFYGSLVIAFVQGAAAGALIRGIPVDGMQYAGGPLVWLHPFPILTGTALVIAYALLGAGWLIFKTRGPLRDWAYSRVPVLVFGLFLLLALSIVASLILDPGVLARTNLSFHKWGLIFPVIGVAALLGTLVSARAKRDHVPLVMMLSFLLAALCTVGAMIWPYLVPYSLTIADAASPESSLQFFSIAGFIVLPLILVYTVGLYWLFRGKVDHHEY